MPLLELARYFTQLALINQIVIKNYFLLNILRFGMKRISLCRLRAPSYDSTKETKREDGEENSSSGDFSLRGIEQPDKVGSYIIELAVQPSDNLLS